MRYQTVTVATEYGLATPFSSGERYRYRYDLPLAIYFGTVEGINYNVLLLDCYLVMGTLSL